MPSRVVIVGAGIGGLSAAAVLARRGHAVTVLERAEHLGGKIRAERFGDAAVDVGPTVLTMKWALERVFDAAGASLAREVELTPLPAVARHGWLDGSELDLHDDVDASAAAIARWSDQRNADGYVAFAAYAKRIWELVREPFIEAPRPTIAGFLGAAARRPAILTQMDSARTMWAALNEFFTDPRLVQLFGRYATYSGSSPFRAPATLNCIAHVEREGVYAPKGGMRSLPLALARVAQAHGATLRTGVHVAEITVDGGGVSGVRLADGELISASAVVFNGDVGALRDGLLGGQVKKTAPAAAPRSLSAVTVAGVLRPSGRRLLRHNVFFSADYAREFEELERGEVPSEPSIYVCAQDREGEPDRTSERGERVFFIVNAPPNGGQGRARERQECERNLFRMLSRHQLTFSSEGPTVVTTPADFDARFPATGGALYGAATAGMWSTFGRAGATTSIRGLYLTGGSVHPGSGVPMAALSGLSCADSVSAAPRSIARSLRTGTLGGIWMR